MKEIKDILDMLGDKRNNRIIGVLLYELGHHSQSLKMTEQGAWNPSGDLDRKAKDIIEARDLLLSLLK